MIQEGPSTRSQDRAPFAKGIVHVPISLVGQLIRIEGDPFKYLHQNRIRIIQRSWSK